MRLLLATAEPDLRLSLELLLGEQPGVQIVGTASESEGLLALLRITKPDMVVTDWDLPGRPFLEILLPDRKLSKRLQIIILIARDSDGQVALAAGADAVVVKGGPPNLLLTAFQKLCNQQSNEQES